MPKEVMDEIGLSITKPYHDPFSFDSRKVKFLGLIKDLVINLSQLPSKSIVMDIVVADIPPQFGLLLSHSWSKRMGGTLQIDLTYATIPMFGGETKRLYRENQLAYIISNAKNSINHPIYAVDIDFGACILQIDDSHPTSMKLTNTTYHPLKEVTTSFWSMFFDGANSQALEGGDIVLIYPLKETIHLSYKLDFKTANNIVE